jgi:endonuclease/exonuclease/phosphatase family metal-dependent hydrolase
LYADEDAQHISTIFFKQDIELAEAESGHKNTIIFGDFNMNPFDKGMVSVVSLNSLPSLKIAKNGSRVFQGREHSFFYNPSWNLLGDLDDSPGTYFHGSPSSLSHYWNILNQVIVRPTIADRFQTASLKILKNAGSHSLVNPDGKPSVSDHLPIFFCMDIR